MNNVTHTYVLLGISRQAYEEIANKLRDAGYEHVFSAGGEIDMHGIGLVAEEMMTREGVISNAI